jgi:hypothetical protein
MAEPGWRTDPMRRFELRWFDGRRWTKRVRVGDAEAIDTLSVPNDLQPPPRRSGGEPEWRPDPGDPAQERFFDGHDWTAATRDRRRRQERPGVQAWPVPRTVVLAAALGAVVVVAAVVLLLVL